MPGILLSLLLGAIGSAIPIYLSHGLSRSNTGRSPDDPLPPSSTPSETRRVPLAVAPFDPAALHRMILSLLASVGVPAMNAQRAARLFVAHAIVAGNETDYPRGNPMWLTAHKDSPGTWSLYPMTTETREGIRYVLHPVRLFAEDVGGVAAYLRALPPEARKAAARGDVDGYVAALVRSGATSRDGGEYALALRRALSSQR